MSLKSFEQLLSQRTELIRQYHTCPLLLVKKKRLEKLVRKSKNQNLKRHFKTPFRLRKVEFYRKIIYDIFKEGEYLEDRQLT